MHFKPLSRYGWYTPFRQPAIVQRSLDNSRPGHKPVTPVTASGFGHLRRVNPQPDELPSPGTRTLPLFPVVHPNASSQPLIQFRHYPIELADPKIVQPPHDVAL